MPLTLPSLKRIHRQALRDGTASEMTVKQLRRLIKEREDWECTNDEWKDGGLKEEARAQWEKLVDATKDDEPSPPPAKKRKEAAPAKDEDGDEERKPKTKYERASEKNLKTFMGAVVGDVLGGLVGGASDDEEDFDEDDASDEDESCSSTALSPSPSPKKVTKPRSKQPASTVAPDDDTSPRASGSGSGSPAPKKKSGKRTSDASSISRSKKGGGAKKVGARRPKDGFKSAEYVADSDDSSHEVALRRSDEEGAKKGKGKGKGKGRAIEGKPKKERKAPEPKPGDAPKGTEEEEDRIKKLKELLAAASGPRAFNASTGAERTLPVARRTEILEALLKRLGLPVKNGKLPSLAKAKEVGEKRMLEREMQELSGNPAKSGLRDGKRVHGDTSDSGGGGGGGSDARANPGDAARKRQVLEERKKFGAFLGDQSSDSD